MSHAKFDLVDEIALIGSANWTSNSAKAEELSCVIATTPEGRLQMLRRFLSWRALSKEWTAEDFQLALESRGQQVKGTASAVSQGIAQGAASPQRKPERAKSEPRLSPPKEIDLTTQIMQ